MINRLEKCKVEKNDVNFKALLDERNAKQRRLERIAKQAQVEQEKKAREEQKRLADLKSYAGVFKEGKMHTNTGNVPDEDDFM